MKQSDFNRFMADDATAPARGSKTVVPHDTNEIWTGEFARSLMVFSEGDVCFVGADGVEDTWTFTADMSYPQMIPVAVSIVKDTGTDITEGNIKALR